MLCKLTIIIPVRDEGINLKRTLKGLKALVDVPHELLIIYDSPEDNSVKVIQEIRQHYPEMRGVQNTYGRGVPNAIRFGIDQAQGEYILILTADDLGPILSVDQITKLIDSGYDFINMTRYSKGGRYLGGHPLSRLLSWWANRIYYWVSKTDITDFTLGIKMFRKSMAKELNLQAQMGWAIGFEMTIKALLYNYKVTEIPLISINRLFGGKSSFTAWPWIKEYSRWFLWGVKEQAKRKQLRIQNFFVPRNAGEGCHRMVM